MPFPTPTEAFATAISQWEGLWQADPNDAGNYARCADGTRKLIGTMRGVTPDIYAAFQGVDPCSVTATEMQSNVTLELAAQIGVQNFFNGPKFNQLTWSPLVAIAVDIGWGSGPGLAVKMIQQLIGAVPDGAIGPQTAALLDQYLAANNIATACDQLTEARINFYLSISQPGSSNAGFRAGWLNRANWYLSTNPSPCWWDSWRGWAPTAPAVTSRPDA